jgi:hypothetical protein
MILQVEPGMRATVYDDDEDYGNVYVEASGQSENGWLLMKAEDKSASFLQLKLLGAGKLVFFKGGAEADRPKDGAFNRRILTRQEAEGYWDHGIIIGNRLVREENGSVVSLKYADDKKTKFAMVQDKKDYTAEMNGQMLCVSSGADDNLEIWTRQAHLCDKGHRLKTVVSASYPTSRCPTCKADSDRISWCRECLGSCARNALTRPVRQFLFLATITL